MTRKIGLFGGCFDPIHYGHIRPVQEARQLLGLDRVLFLPTAVPPHKPGRLLAPALARYAMVELALLEEEGLFVSTFELTLGRPAFTVDTLEHFRAAEPQASLYLLVGGDSFSDLTTWRRWREIVELARLAVLVRPSWTSEDIHKSLPPELIEVVTSKRVEIVSNQPVGVSSTEVRRQLAAGEAPPGGAIPALVLEYIRKYSLY